MAQPPNISGFSDLAGRDGETVVLEGVYVKRLTQRKMNDPSLHFFGFVDLTLEGGSVGLSDSRRDHAEVEAFAGKRVQVRGIIALDRDRDTGGEFARPDPTPTLLNPVGLVPID